MLLGLIDRGTGLGDTAARRGRDHAEQSARSRSATCSSGSFPKRERVKRLGDVVDRTAILALAGRRRARASVFTTNPAAQCKTCHKAGDVGETVGPDLTKIGAKYNKAALLDQILEPSKTIDPQFITYLLETKDGRVLTGLVVEKTERRGRAQGRPGQDDQGPERGDRAACSAVALADAGAVAPRPDGAAGGRLAGVPGVAAVKMVE